MLGEPIGSSPEVHETPDAVRIAVLISNKGSGSNLKAIMDAQGRGDISAQIGLVISDKPDAKGLEHLEGTDIPSEVLEFGKGSSREEYGSRVAQKQNAEGIKIAVMAGFATILPQSYFEEFQGVTINVHPGLLPEVDGSPFIFPDGTQAPWNQGLMTETAVANFLELRYGGSTVHVATVDADNGPVIIRTLEEVRQGDDVDSFYARLKLKEHQALLSALGSPRKIFEIAGRNPDGSKILPDDNAGTSI
jgi:phosphoribosylglycinamide formyltransferase 1